MDTKTCYRCKADQPLTEFYRHRKMKDGRLNLCRTCKKAETDDWRKNNPARFNETRRRRELLSKYGLTTDEYDALLLAQGGGCAGCGEDGMQHHQGRGNTVSSRPLTVDHDHSTGRVRGLLCHTCNWALHKTGERPDVLRRLAAYLEGF